MIQKGQLLLSEPFMTDKNFQRAVVLLCEHSDNGTFGFVINRKTTILLSDVLEEENLPPITLNIGGPVEQNTLHFLHRLGNYVKNTVQITDDLYWSGDYETVIEGLKEKIIQPKDVSFYLGYTGWTNEQLSIEVSQHTWMITESKSSDIFDGVSTNLWSDILKSMGGKYKEIASYPIDPRLN